VIPGGLESPRFEGATTRLTLADTYPDQAAAKNADLAAYVDSGSARFGSYTGLDVEREGRMVWTDGTIPTAEFDFLSPGGPGDSVHTSTG
jgi:hypothetical protein